MKREEKENKQKVVEKISEMRETAKSVDVIELHDRKEILLCEIEKNKMDDV